MADFDFDSEARAARAANFERMVKQLARELSMIASPEQKRVILQNMDVHLRNWLTSNGQDPLGYYFMALAARQLNRAGREGQRPQWQRPEGPRLEERRLEATEQTASNTQLDP